MPHTSPAVCMAARREASPAPTCVVHAVCTWLSTYCTTAVRRAHTVHSTPRSPRAPSPCSTSQLTSCLPRAARARLGGPTARFFARSSAAPPAWPAGRCRRTTRTAGRRRHHSCPSPRRGGSRGRLRRPKMLLPTPSFGVQPSSWQLGVAGWWWVVDETQAPSDGWLALSQGALSHAHVAQAGGACHNYFGKL